MCSAGTGSLEFEFWGKSHTENGLLTSRDGKCVPTPKPLLLGCDSLGERLEFLNLPCHEFLTLGRAFNLILGQDCFGVL